MQSFMMPHPSTGNTIESIRKQQDRFQIDITILNINKRSMLLANQIKTGV
jgi:hypothetical protein